MRDREAARSGWAEEFTAFVAEVEPRLDRALFAAYGALGPDALADGLAYAWEHWRRVRSMANPSGYVYRVACSRARRRRTPLFLPEVEDGRLPDVEPRLTGELERLSERQRIAVVLVHGFEWTHPEVAEVLGVSVSTVRNHLARGMKRLRDGLEVEEHDRA